MFRLNGLIAACALALTLNTANTADAATVFNVSGSYGGIFGAGTLSGTLTVDVTAGAVTAADLMVSGLDMGTPYLVSFTDLYPGVPSPAGVTSSPYNYWQVEAWTPDFMRGLELVLQVTPSPPSLVGYTGGIIALIAWDQSDGVAPDGIPYFDDLYAIGSCGGDLAFPSEDTCGSLTTNTPPVNTTPLPPSLALFMSGLVILFWAGWRKIRGAGQAAELHQRQGH